MTEAGGERIFIGIGVSGSVAIAPVYVLRGRAAVTRRIGTAEEELSACLEVIEAAKGELEALIASQDQLAADILEFQLALLDDHEMLAPVFRAIEDGTPWNEAWSAKLDREIADYRAGGADTLAARADDLADLRDRMLRAGQGEAAEREAIPRGVILVAADLTPSAFIGIDWSGLAGAATLGGSPVSHVSILARARGINFVVALKAGLDELRPGDIAILDAAQGLLTVDPAAESLAAAHRRIANARGDHIAIEALLSRPAMTASGERVRIMVNIDEPGRLDALSPEHCDGVGLTRTEFLFTGRHLPDEEKQLAFYRRLIEWAGGRPVTIRTLDAGGDKPIPGVTIDGETNPFLGVRGLRLSLAQPEIFLVQLRALARAAVLGPLKVMVPMVTVPRELDAVREMLRAEIADLQRAGVSCAMPPLGMMVEVPAAALTAASFDADFYSIGSNDLIQYATAAARDNASLAALADPLNPAVLELIGRTVAAGRERGLEVSLCGDMASSAKCIPALLDAGLDTLSCAPAQIGPVKLAVSRHAHGGAGDG
jgi:phosphotransferase system enzyme I (PtsI)